jgi:hypothetical protein
LGWPWGHSLALTLLVFCGWVLTRKFYIYIFVKCAWFVPNGILIDSCQMAYLLIHAKWHTYWFTPNGILIDSCQMAYLLIHAKWHTYWLMPNGILIDSCQMAYLLICRFLFVTKINNMGYINVWHSMHVVFKIIYNILNWNLLNILLIQNILNKTT